MEAGETTRKVLALIITIMVLITGTIVMVGQTLFGAILVTAMAMEDIMDTEAIDMDGAGIDGIILVTPVITDTDTHIMDT